MGGGSWTSQSFVNYSKSVGRDVDLKTGLLKGDYKAQDMFVQKYLAPELNPYNVMRECCDSEEHPNTKSVILALDVTGSMGQSAVEVAKKLNTVMTDLYKKITDVEFMIMGIGDLSYDDSPIQASQFESDIRIAEQLDKVWFEFGGGGNSYESYTAAWYFGSRHCKLDCWNRNKKGIIITMGDELLNPYLPEGKLAEVTGDSLQGNIETKDLYEESSRKYEIYHLNVEHGFSSEVRAEDNVRSFSSVLGSDHVYSVNINGIADKIIDIIVNYFKDNNNSTFDTNSNEISW